MLINIDPVVKPRVEQKVVSKSEDKLEEELKKYQEVKALLERTKAGNEAARLNHKVENLAKKLARGEYLTESERALLEKEDPEKMRKAQLANIQRRNMEDQLKNARTKEEARSILTGASVGVSTAFNQDEEYGGLLSAGVNKMITDYAQGKESKTTYLQFRSVNIKI